MPAALALMLMLAASSQPKPAPFPTVQGPGGALVTAPTFSLPEGGKAVVAGKGSSETQILEEPDAVFHPRSGVRLPRVHKGCRLSFVAPLTDKSGRPDSFARGLMAEYDCTPSADLTQVEISLEVNAPQLRKKDPQALTRIASQINQSLAQVDRSQCVPAFTSPNPMQAGLTATQCGIRWDDPRDPAHRSYGAATVAYGRGASFVRFSRRCVDAQCGPSAVALAAFVDSFDLRGLQSPES
ncbi:hypothetical protein [Phenylobacterium deserti]|uniref:Uncharacterized protein n=1 Tax=Phenylobacterium deserti TaxID=1914756 RepID=A0A328A9W7_9CAUL|nr:hypothetical protein [Phenylobacterium deserti]RAK50956.1 hypothetical protein DJ018_17495 [Phenylobacterium deserti]